MKYFLYGFILTILFTGVAFACEPETLPTPTVNPCDELTVDVAPNAPCITPTVTSEATPSATPTIEPTSHSDGLSDGRSDGRSSCPECTMAPTPTPTLIQTVGWK